MMNWNDQRAEEFGGIEQWDPRMKRTTAAAMQRLQPLSDHPFGESPLIQIISSYILQELVLQYYSV
jgi:hypothetical protein